MSRSYSGRDDFRRLFSRVGRGVSLTSMAETPKSTGVSILTYGQSTIPTLVDWLRLCTGSTRPWTMARFVCRKALRFPRECSSTNCGGPIRRLVCVLRSQRCHLFESRVIFRAVNSDARAGTIPLCRVSSKRSAESDLRSTRTPLVCRSRPSKRGARRLSHDISFPWCHRLPAASGP